MSDFDPHLLAYPPLQRWVRRRIEAAPAERIGFAAQAALATAIGAPGQLERSDMLRAELEKVVTPYAGTLAMLQASAARFQDITAPEADIFNVYQMQDRAFAEDLLRVLEEVRGGTKAREDYGRLALIIDPPNTALIVGHHRGIRHGDLLAGLGRDPEAMGLSQLTADVSLQKDDNTILVHALRHSVVMSDDMWRQAALMVVDAEAVKHYARKVDLFQTSFSILLGATPRAEGEELLVNDTLRADAGVVAQVIESSGDTRPFFFGVGGDQPMPGKPGKGGGGPATPPAGAAGASGPTSPPPTNSGSSAAPIAGSFANTMPFVTGGLNAVGVPQRIGISTAMPLQPAPFPSAARFGI
jgi:hypothetical protein